MLNSVH